LSEDNQYYVNSIIEHFGLDVSWGIESGNNYFQYTFEDILVRFYADSERRALLQGSYVLIENTGGRAYTINFNDFMFFLPSDIERNVLIDGLIIMKSLAR
jgi:hypothetical protein